jgi:HD-GYP domain-containing protein (c-di-GMP phosphodiesterase class II)
MAMVAEYFDDGSSFHAIDPLSINPEYLTTFSIFERNYIKKDKYRFRCLLVDSKSIPKDRLIQLLKTWDTVYIHKKQDKNYTEYLKNNLNFILSHDEIDVRKKTSTLIHLSTEVVTKSFEENFSTIEGATRAVENIQNLITQAMGFLSSIDSLNGLVDLMGHDYETHGHSIKVGWLLATFINANRDLFPIQSTATLRQLIIQSAVAGFLHDIGKIKIPKNVINKPGKLNNLEYVIIQSHTAYSTSLLFEAGLPNDSLKAILYHHENEDGSGYPCGYSGDQIPLLAKICHIVDVFDALTSKRSYKEAKTPYQALSIMAGNNPNIDILKKFEAEARENKRTPVTAIIRDDYDSKLKRLRAKEIIEEEAEKRVEARMRLRDRGMSHCFDKKLLKRFIITINKAESFDLSGLLK